MTCHVGCVKLSQALVGLERGFTCVEEPVFPDDDGLELLPFTGECLTFEGEINKLAVNVAFGRYKVVDYRLLIIMKRASEKSDFFSLSIIMRRARAKRECFLLIIQGKKASSYRVICTLCIAREVERAAFRKEKGNI